MAGGQLSNDIARLCTEGEQLADMLERGQAETPLKNHFQTIIDQMDGGGFSAVFLGLDSEARTRFMSLCLAQDPRLLTLHDYDHIGMVELLLDRGSFALETADGMRQDYQDAASFITALEQKDVTQVGDINAWVDPVRLNIPAPKGVRGLRLIMPKNLDAFEASPNLLTRLLSQSNTMIIAGSIHKELSDGERAHLSDMVESMALILPIVFLDSDMEEDQMPKVGWWQEALFTNAHTVEEPLSIVDQPNEPQHLFIFNDQDKKRAILHESFYARKLGDAIMAVEQMIKGEEKMLDGRKKRASIKAKSGHHDTISQFDRSDQDQVLKVLDQKMQALNKELEKKEKKAFQPNGAVSNIVERTINSLEFADLEQELGAKKVFLHFSDDSTRSIITALKTGYRTVLSQDLVFMRDEINALRRQLEDEIEKVSGQRLSLDVRPPDQTELWKQLEPVFSLNIRYKGEMAKRGFFQRLSEGRRAAFGLLMGVGLVGMMMGNSSMRSSPLVGIGIFLVFIVTIISSYRSWGQEDAEKIDDEMTKLKDGLTADIKRMLGDVQRERSAFLKAALERVREQVAQVMVDTIQTQRDQKQAAAEKDKKAAEKSMGVLEQRAREIGQMQTSLRSLSQGFKALERSVSDGLSHL